jgi:hypothetical protein
MSLRSLVTYGAENVESLGKLHTGHFAGSHRLDNAVCDVQAQPLLVIGFMLFAFSKAFL